MSRNFKPKKHSELWDQQGLPSAEEMRRVFQRRYKRELKDIHRKPPFRPRLLWWCLSLAKRTGGWDIWLGEKLGLESDNGDGISGFHWHTARPPFVVYREEY